MKSHSDLNKLTIFTLDVMNKQGIKPTAKELYYEIKQENPKLIRNSFRSFVKIINIFPEIDMQQIRGKPATYLAKLK